MKVEVNQLQGPMLAGDEADTSRGTNKRKTKFCMYHLQGVCQFGDKCAFAHSVDELQRGADGNSGNTTTTATQSDEEARPVDMFYKKAPCLWYERGWCRKGEQCRFAHGAEELRKYGERQPKVSADKSEDFQKMQRRHESRQDAMKGNRHMAEGRVTSASAAGHEKKILHSTKGAPGLEPVRLSNRFEPMFVQPMSSPVAPAFSDSPPPGIALPPGLTPASIAFLPAPCFEQDEAYGPSDVVYSLSGTSSLVEGLSRGLAEAPVEELRREWAIMEQQQRALENAALACGTSLPLQPRTNEWNALLQQRSGKAQLHDKAWYSYEMDMQSQLIGA